MKHKKALITGIAGQDGSYLADDTVIDTGQTLTVREFVQIVFEELEPNYEDQLFFIPDFIVRLKLKSWWHILQKSAKN